MRTPCEHDGIKDRRQCLICTPVRSKAIAPILGEAPLPASAPAPDPVIVKRAITRGGARAKYKRAAARNGHTARTRVDPSLPRKQASKAPRVPVVKPLASKARTLVRTVQACAVLTQRAAAKDRRRHKVYARVMIPISGFQGPKRKE